MLFSSFFSLSLSLSLFFFSCELSFFFSWDNDQLFSPHLHPLDKHVLKGLVPLTEKREKGLRTYSLIFTDSVFLVMVIIPARGTKLFDEIMTNVSACVV